VRFEQFVFDLSDLLADEDTRVRRPAEYGLRALLAPSPAMLAQDRYGRSDYIAEGHYKIAMPLLSLLFPMIALVTLLAGGYRRSGFGRRVVVAVGVAVIVQAALFAVRPQVRADADLWPLMYLPHLIGVLYVAALLVYLARERRGGGARAPA
jgi:lipopolysaccharide export system permease protein